MIRALMIILLVFAQSNVASIDATAEGKQSTRKTASNRVGINGRILPVELKTAVVKAGREGNSLFVDFIIINRGKEPITLPVSLDAQQFEPNDTNPSAFQRLDLFLSVDRQGSAVVVAGGAELYGKASIPLSVQILQPEESLVVHTKSLLRSPNGDISGPQIFKGEAFLYDETLKPRGTLLDRIDDLRGQAHASSFAWTVPAQK
jgi:hypothetical protein